MKILLLNPHINATHQVAKSLTAQGHALLMPADAEEAWQMIQLHDSNLDLTIVHREGIRAKDDGEKLVARIKAVASYADLPLIFTSEVWSESDFGNHQQGGSGANAYLRWPFEAHDLLSLIGEIFGEPPLVLTDPTATPSAPQNTGQTVPLPTSMLQSPTESATIFAGTASAPPTLSPPPSGADSPFTLEAMSPTGTLNLDNLADAGAGIVLDLPSASQPFELSSAPSPTLELSPAPPSTDDDEGEVHLPTAMIERPVFGEEIPAPIAEGAEPEVHSLDLSSLAMNLGSGSDEPEAPATLDSEPVVKSGDSLSGQTYDLSSFAGATDHSENEEGGTANLDTRYNESPHAHVSTTTDSEEELAQEMAGEMPYLFSGRANQSPSADLAQSLSIGDAVVPGGAANAPDVETLKRYLLLREQDVAALSGQLRAAGQEIAKVKNLLREEHARNAELSHLAGEQKRRLDEFDKVKQGELDSLRTEAEEMRFQARSKADKARVLEGQVRDAAYEIERLKERVRSDLRKIRIREKELENRLEIVKKDSEALLLTRENKIIELKRKVDLLEFNMDLLQDQYMREKEGSTKLRERLAKAAQVVRVAGGLLDQPKDKGSEPSTAAQSEKAREAS